MATDPLLLTPAGDRDWNGDGRDGIGVVCKNGHGISWNLMNGVIGGTPQIMGGFGNSDFCLRVTGDWTGIGHTGIGVACHNGPRPDVECHETVRSAVHRS